MPPIKDKKIALFRAPTERSWIVSATIAETASKRLNLDALNLCSTNS